MARRGPPLTKPFDINPTRGHALPARERHRSGGRAGSPITFPGTNPSPDPKEEPLKQGKPEGGRGVKFLGCSPDTARSLSVFNRPSTICAYPPVRLVTSHGHRQQRGGPTRSGVTSRMLEQLTYAQIGERLKISSDGARAIVKRSPLPRSHASDGKTLVAIDLDELPHKPLPARSPRGQPVTDVVATLKARIEQLEAELAAEQQRSAHERERADQLVSSQDKLVIQLKN